MNVSTSVMSDDETKLWHLRLGHIGERDIFNYIHSDLWVPSRKTSLGGCNFLLTLIDDYSRKVLCYFIKNKDDVFDVFID